MKTKSIIKQMTIGALCFFSFNGLCSCELIEDGYDGLTDCTGDIVSGCSDGIHDGIRGCQRGVRSCGKGDKSNEDIDSAATFREVDVVDYSSENNGNEDAVPDNYMDAYEDAVVDVTEFEDY